MMHAMHIGCNDNQTEQAINTRRYAQVAVIKKGAGIEHHLKDHNSDCRRPEESNGAHLDTQGDQDLNRVKAVSTGNIQIQVGMVHPVEAPEERNPVKAAVLQVNNQVKQQYDRDNLYPSWHGQHV